MCVPFFIYLKRITFFKLLSKTGCIRVHFRISVFRGYLFLNVYMQGLTCRVSTTICFQVNNFRKTRGPSRNNTIGSISFFFTTTKVHMAGYYILHYMGFLCQAETSPMHKPHGKAVFPGFFSIRVYNIYLLIFLTTWLFMLLYIFFDRLPWQNNNITSSSAA